MKLLAHGLDTAGRLDAATAAVCAEGLARSNDWEGLATLAARADLGARVRHQLVERHHHVTEVRDALNRRSDLDARDAAALCDGVPFDDLVTLVKSARNAAVCDIGFSALGTASRPKRAMLEALLASTGTSAETTCDVVDIAVRHRNSVDLLPIWLQRRDNDLPHNVAAVIRGAEEWQDALTVMFNGWWQTNLDMVIAFVDRHGGPAGTEAACAADRSLDQLLRKIIRGLDEHVDLSTLEPLGAALTDRGWDSAASQLEEQLRSRTEKPVNSAALAREVAATRDTDRIGEIARIISSRACDEERIASAALRNPLVEGRDLSTFSRWAPNAARRRAARSDTASEIAWLLIGHDRWSATTLRIPVRSVIDYAARVGNLSEAIPALVTFDDLPVDWVAGLPARALSGRTGTGVLKALIELADGDVDVLEIAETLSDDADGTPIGELIESARLISSVTS